MDEEGIGLVLARASELRSKITNCIHSASSTKLRADERESREGDDYVAEEEEEEEEENLLSIRDAMESLEAQLSSLQALQQQQWYEREAALAEIDHSRKKLLKQLKDYKGEDLEVIHEASVFASETVEENNELLLPPYPTRPSHSLLSENNTNLSSRKHPQNGLLNSEINQLQSHQKPQSGLRSLLTSAAKTVFTLVGVVTILGLAGFEPRIRKGGNEFKVLNFFQQREDEGEREKAMCPPGRVLVIEDGEARCLVKERVEIPFESLVTTPDISYGCG